MKIESSLHPGFSSSRLLFPVADDHRDYPACESIFAISSALSPERLMIGVT